MQSLCVEAIILAFELILGLLDDTFQEDVPQKF